MKLKQLNDLIGSYNVRLMRCDSHRNCKQILEEMNLLEKLVDRIKKNKYNSIKTPLKWG